jgi:DNA invertase Pin-like site-specific DNA recombinase
VKETDVIVLDMPLLNTKKHAKNLLGKFLSDIVLQLLSYIAEMERNNIRKRQAEGIAAAKLRGVKFGRKCQPLPAEFFLVVGQWREGRITAREAARRLHVSCSWLYRKTRELNI